MILPLKKVNWDVLGLKYHTILCEATKLFGLLPPSLKFWSDYLWQLSIGSIVSRYNALVELLSKWGTYSKFWVAWSDYCFWFSCSVDDLKSRFEHWVFRRDDDANVSTSTHNICAALSTCENALKQVQETCSSLEQENLPTASSPTVASLFYNVGYSHILGHLIQVFRGNPSGWFIVTISLIWKQWKQSSMCSRCQMRMCAECPVWTKSSDSSSDTRFHQLFK